MEFTQSNGDNFNLKHGYCSRTIFFFRTGTEKKVDDVDEKHRVSQAGIVTGVSQQ